MKVTTIQAQPILTSNNYTKPVGQSDVSFESVLKDATIIYAHPESNGVQQVREDFSSAKQFDVSDTLAAIFKQASETYNVSENLLKAVAKAESDFDPDCTSNAGAMGIMQLMPGTASELGVTNPYDPEENIMGGAKLLSQLLDKYDNNIPYALAAYNAGSGNVDKYGGIPPFTETQNYVEKIMGYLGQGTVAIPENQNQLASTPSTTTDGDYTIHATPIPYYNRQF